MKRDYKADCKNAADLLRRELKRAQDRELELRWEAIRCAIAILDGEEDTDCPRPGRR